MARATTTSDVFNALGEQGRRQIVTLLAERERSVHEITNALEMRQPQVSKHLAVLREVDLVVVRKAGRERYYRLQAERLRPIYDWVEQFRAMWEARLDRLEEYLQEITDKE